ncbi:hypothetical protein DS2_02460 [Catenovulum agarivorans DS-2]|uniref:Lipoprotein n=1 Tax=Catenovulum agarivorans DS-2 TaxID=1328313 RepID=W7QII3_9ALTE|nr:hypothetical protein [Catenovulum agarivorans]EWH11651.1 hypothetical protein DS2_02460 [Catenovulum agarivorans DS-2]
MQQGSKVYKPLKYSAFALATLILAACSSSESAKDQVKNQYTYVAEDALIIGLSVVDGDGNTATEIAPGEYQFAEGVTPVPPVEFASRNTDEQAFLTFQDIDESGDLSEADIAYNVGFEMQFVPEADPATGQVALFANPIAALIPATGIPASGIGGLTQEIVQEALTKGVKAASTAPTTINGEVTTIKDVIAKTSAKLTAVQEAIVAKEGNKVSAGNKNSLNLLKEAASSTNGSLVSDTGLSDFLNSAINTLGLSTGDQELVKEAAKQIALTISASKVGSGTQKVLYESIIKVVQTKVKPTSSTQQITTSITTDAVKSSAEGLNTSIELAEQVKQTGGKAAFINSLLLAPVPGNEGELLDNSVAGFEMTFNSASNQITLAATGASFDGLVLSYTPDSGVYAGIAGNQAVFVSLSANAEFLSGFDLANVRLMASCTFDFELGMCGSDNQDMGIYPLATKAELCAAMDSTTPSESFLQSLNANYGENCPAQ